MKRGGNEVRKHKKGTPLSESPLFGLARCCVAGLLIGPGALPVSIGDRQQQPKCEHHGQTGSMFRDPGPSLNTKRFGLGRFGQSFQEPPGIAIGCNVAFQFQSGFVKGGRFAPDSRCRESERVVSNLPNMANAKAWLVPFDSVRAHFEFKA